MKKLLLLLILIPNIAFANVYNDINLVRNNKLIVDKQLVKTSSFKVNDILFHKYFSHTNHFGDDITDIFKRFNVKWTLLGEVLARGYSEKDVVSAWLNSKSHKEVLLDDNYTKIGCYKKNNINVCHFK